MKKNSINLEKLIREEIKKIKPYVPGKPISEVKEEYGLENVVKLASNENPLGTSRMVHKAVTEELDNVKRYPDGGCRKLKSKLAEKISVSEEMILFANGSDGLLKIIGDTFLTKKDSVIISSPTFVEYIFVSNLAGSNLIRVFMDDYKQNLPAISEAVNSSTKVIFLTNPHNPAGTIFTAEEFADLMNELPEDIIVVVDEAYYEYVRSDKYPDVLEYIDEGYPIILLRTFSKAYGLAALRIGYAVSSPEIIELLSKARDPFNVNSLAQVAAIAALEDEDFFAKSIEVNEKGKDYLYKELNKRNIEYVPTQSNFILINLKMDSMHVFREMMKMGVIIRPGKPLGYPEHIRVTIGTYEENKLFIDCVDKLRTS